MTASHISHSSQEVVLMFHSISGFESGYQKRLLQRICEPVNYAFPGGLARAPPTQNDILAIERAISRYCIVHLAYNFGTVLGK
jgi:hypothetical protein